MSEAQTPQRVVVVGASAGGLTVAETLRREGYSGDIVMIGDETEPPYDRPPLSKQVLKGSWDPARTHLRDRTSLDALECEWLLGEPARSVHLDNRTVEVGGRQVPYDELVIATGVRPRPLPIDIPPGVHTLRTLADAQELAKDMRKGASLAVIGSGFLGIEVAAVAIELGMNVTVVDVLDAPLVRQLGPVVAAQVRELHESRGTRFRLGRSVVALDPTEDDRVSLGLDNGESFTADVVLVGIGSLPNTDWLVGSGLKIDNGIVCDEFNRAGQHVWAVGDVARWFHPVQQRHVRIEHRMNATEQGISVAKGILGTLTAFAPVPYFWTDQYEVKIQAYGTLPEGADVRVVAGSIEDGKFAVAYHVAGEAVGALSWNMPREVRGLRQELVARTHRLLS
ncbi:NAD(P)/FAD-dependent oxidoreductase [Rhodococcus sp. NPDC057529]|uniref:NAD(P)/FAD-dependent oxidoreductase n=1 Tax=Rhodococcus sp. NPDC057529 TaxID=3346158 RepID=UPI003672AF76